MKPFDWKRKFDAPFTAIDSNDGFDRYHIENTTGKGTIIACTVFPGLQAVKIDFSMDRCDNLLQSNKNIIEITYCIDGCFESAVNKRYYHFVAPGDFAVSFSGKKESHGEFPTGRYQGINIFLEPETFIQNHEATLQDFAVNLERIHALASLTPRYFTRLRNNELDAILKAIGNEFVTKRIPLLRVKVLELLVFLSNLCDTDVNDSPVYLKNNQVLLAKSAQKLLTANLSKHVTIEYMATELGTGTTVLKKSFKSVYGIPIYQYQKELRLQKAQQLLRETALPVSSIAAKIGYSNPAKFSSAFKIRYGISPMEYKLQNRTKKE